MTPQLHENLLTHLGETALMAVQEALLSSVIYPYVKVVRNLPSMITSRVSEVVGICLISETRAFVGLAIGLGGLGFIERESTIQMGSGS